MPNPLDGLTGAEVRERIARGAVNDVPVASTRSAWQIVRANVLTPFNFLLGGLLAVILIVGPYQDALFGFVLVANAVVGIVQELRAKWTLDRLSLLSAPRARVVRDGRTQEMPVDAVVLDDVLELRSGDQVVVDGEALSGEGLELDESLLTGESDTVPKAPGNEVLSGSFVAAGTGRYRATRVGADAYARRLADEAKRFTLVDSELRNGINRIVVLVTWALIPTAVLLIVSQLRSDATLHEALRGAVAGTVAMVPEGLVLLTSVAFAVGVVRLARRQVLVQELPAVEGLARVDVLCIDKTGTLTEGRLAVERLELLDGSDVSATERALAALAASDPTPNATMRAVSAAYPAHGDARRATSTVPFSSARRWSGASFDGPDSWILGAPDVLLDMPSEPATEAARRRAASEAATGRRVLVLARTSSALTPDAPPTDVRPQALVVLQDRVRADASDTLRYFAEQGVAVKVISGDAPDTVAAIASEVGLPGADGAVDARDLPTDPERLAAEIERHAIFGRVTPQQKRDMVRALQANGHTVAMTGDGVNDVLALKDADIGIAMGSGSQATRAAAQLVLLTSTFSSLPAAVAEGRRVIGNIERTANLFLTKTVYAMLLSIAVGVIGLAFPFFPRHLTIISSLTIGIPGFFLALEPNAERARPGFVPRVLRFAVPAGIAVAATTLAAYLLVKNQPSVSAIEARTSATLVLFWMGMLVLVMVARPLNTLRRILMIALVAAFATVLAVPALRSFFELQIPTALITLAGFGIAAIGALFLLLFVPSRRPAPA